MAKKKRPSRKVARKKTSAHKLLAAVGCNDATRDYLKNMTALALVNDEGGFAVAEPTDSGKAVDWAHEAGIALRLQAMNDRGAGKPEEMMPGNACGLRFEALTQTQITECATRGAMVALVKSHYTP